MVPFCNVLYPKGNVEDWLLEVEKLMRLSLKEIIRDSLGDYHKVMNEERARVYYCAILCVYKHVLTCICIAQSRVLVQCIMYICNIANFQAFYTCTVNSLVYFCMHVHVHFYFICFFSAPSY